MAFIPAKCTQCGANITVDNTKDAGICEFCGTAFVTEKAINNYTINNTNHITAQTVNVYGDGKANDFQVEVHKLVAYTGDSEVVIIPHHITEIGESAFEKNIYIKEVILPQSISSIGDNAFMGCINLNKIELPQGLFSIGARAFYGCESLVEIKIPDSVFIMANSVFSNCNQLKRVKLSENLTYLKGGVFSNCLELEDINLPSNLIRLGGANFGVSCFENCKSLRTLTIPAKVKTIGDHTFDGTNLDKLIFENADEITELGEGYGIFIGAIKIPEIVASESFKKKYERFLTTNQRIERNSSNKSGGCYIATCVYGSYDCPQVWTLRRFRDEVLDTTWYGRAFIHTYYAISPTIVKWFGNQSWFKALWKKRLDNMINTLNEKGFLDTPYHDKY